MQQQIVSGLLSGLEETAISIAVRGGEVRVYPRRELDISLDWVSDNLGKRVLCMLQDGVVTQVKAFG